MHIDDKEELLVDFDNCKYNICTYYESDTGYQEFGCKLLGNPRKNPCLYEDCPLFAKYIIKLNKEKE